MKFSTREDIEAPIEHVFKAVTDFDEFERQALRRGAEVTRQDGGGKAGVDSAWQLRFTFRGKPRDMSARIVDFDPPNGFRAESRSASLDGIFLVELVTLSPRRTRLQVSFEMSPRTLSGRLMIQSMKFARSSLSRKFSARVYEYAQDVQDKYRGTA